MLIDDAGRSLVAGFILVAVSNCSGTDSVSPSAGGSASIGGSPTGGVSSSGSAAVGGTSSAAGGVNTGGNVGTGGAPGTGGANSMGGAQTGGMPATGGSPATGGAAATGGVKSTGGVPNTAGSLSTGGAKATGGRTSTGGAAPTGGSKASAGASATGGSSSAGGASGTTGCGMTNYPAPCNTSGSPCSIDVTTNGTVTTRQYYVKLPSNYDPSKAYPVVFEFHYLGGSAEAIFNDTMYNVRPNFANAIYVIPQGLAGSDGNRGWPNTNNQDINFTKAMVSTLEASYCIDQSRVFSMGFSYGGMMSITIGCLMPDVFRAIGVESGFSIVYNCNPSHEIAVWQTQGDQDTTVTPTNAEAARDIFVKLNHCSSTTQAVNPSPCVAYDNCDTGYPVTWCLIAGESHALWNQSGPAIATFFQKF